MLGHNKPDGGEGGGGRGGWWGGGGVPVMKVMEPGEVAKHDQEEPAGASLKPVILIKLPGTAEMDCGPAGDNKISQVDKSAGDTGGVVGEEKESAETTLDKMITLPGTASKDCGPASDNNNEQWPETTTYAARTQQFRESILGLAFLVLADITKPRKPNTFGTKPDTFGIIPKYLVLYQRFYLRTTPMQNQNIDARD